jgi:exopolysaccharide biosynthesis polyprenyl glycosylphosphotransferase
LSLILVIAGRFITDSIRRILNFHGLGLTRTVVIARAESDRFAQSFHNPAHGRKLQAIITKDFLSELDRTVKSKPIDELIIAWPDLDEKTVLGMIDWAETHFVQFAQVPTLMSVRATNVDTSTLASSPVIFYKRSPLDGWGRIIKRLVDFVFAFILIILLSPVYLILALIVRLSSPGPIIYQEKRIGQDGREIVVGKFRSMYADWRTRFPQIKDWAADEATDIRITRIGRIIRKTNLDEIPQLWDVLLGRMSLVGPRPEQPKYVTQFEAENPGYVKRHYVKSGLTGWAQINGMRGNTPIPERTAYDLFYIQNWSIWFDFRIMIGTVIYMFRQLFK